MLSKLRSHLFNAINARSLRGENRSTSKSLHPSLPLDLSEKADLTPSSIDIVAGGTLGQCYTGLQGDRPVFIKTYESDLSRAVLRKEEALLSLTAPDGFLVQSCEVGEGFWLIMDRLDPILGSFLPEEARKLTIQYDQCLRANSLSDDIEITDTIMDMVPMAQDAAREMCDRGVLSLDLFEKTSMVIERLKTTLPKMPLQLCHGDLGPKNIMSYNARTMAIDWEDAFWSVSGYDYIYWLTFFENRQYLDRHMFDKMETDRETSMAIMVMILVLKSALSLHNGEYKHHSLSIEDRVGEIFAL